MNTVERFLVGGVFVWLGVQEFAPTQYDSDNMYV